MTQTHPRDRLGEFADGELSGEEARGIEVHLAGCTECAREVALIRTMGGAVRKSVMNTEPQRSVWNGVQRRLTQPIGWLLVIAGVGIWIALGVVEWYRSRVLTLEWLAVSAIAIGIVLIAVGVGSEQYREWKATRYRDIER
jgi:anti-sigma factor RsiW